MKDLKEKIHETGFSGEIKDDPETLSFYSHDASMFELRPKVVVSPKSAQDIEKLVSFVATHKEKYHELSLTARSAGTCMSGGAINESIIVDFTSHLNTLISIGAHHAITQPGVYYRDFEEATLKKQLLLPSYPASKSLCAIGGMINNNSGGEKSLEFGKTEKYINELKFVFADGIERTVKPLSRPQLIKKMAQNDFEGNVYKKLYELIEDNYDAIKAAQPLVSKDSTGYHLWNVWDREKGVFDLTQVIVGAQGTLGLVTEANLRLIANPKHSGSLIIFLNHMDNLGDVINKVLEHKPATFEGFDNHTLILSFKLFFYFQKTLGWGGMIKLGLDLLPSLLGFRRGIPEMVLIAQFTGNTDEEVAQKVRALRQDMSSFGHDALFEEDETEEKEKKFFIMRREAFNLLRKKVHDKHTAPFIDDFVVPPKVLPEFLPQLRAIIKKYKLLATLQGHFGDGNFHVIPLMKLEDPKDRAKLLPAMKEVNQLVLKYGGSLSGEHNDGLVRGPWLEQMYGRKIHNIFKRTKYIFDPDNIFNPHKKADADWNFSFSHIRKSF